MLRKTLITTGITVLLILSVACIESRPQTDSFKDQIQRVPNAMVTPEPAVNKDCKD